jgi:hypothetical protein
MTRKRRGAPEFSRAEAERQKLLFKRARQRLDDRLLSEEMEKALSETPLEPSPLGVATVAVPPLVAPPAVVVPAPPLSSPSTLASWAPTAVPATDPLLPAGLGLARQPRGSFIFSSPAVLASREAEKRERKRKHLALLSRLLTLSPLPSLVVTSRVTPAVSPSVTASVLPTVCDPSLPLSSAEEDKSFWARIEANAAKMIAYEQAKEDVIRAGGGVVWNGLDEVFEKWAANGTKEAWEMVFEKRDDGIYLAKK